MKLFVSKQAAIATLSTEKLASLMAGKHKFKKSQYLNILTDKDSSWASYKKTKNNLEKNKIRNAILIGVISSEFKKEVRAYTTDVAQRIYAILLAAFTALHNFGVVSTSIFIGGKYTTQTYGTYIDRFKLLISKEHAPIAKSFLKLNLALPAASKILEHSGFNFNVFATNPFRSFMDTWTNISETSARVPGVLSSASSAFDKINELTNPIKEFLNSGQSLMDTINTTILKLLEWAHSLMEGLTFILMPALRVLATYFLAPQLWHVQAGLAIAELFIGKSHLIPVVTKWVGKSFAKDGDKKQKQNKNNKKQKPQKDKSATVTEHSSAGLFGQFQNLALPGVEAGALVNFITLVMSAIFIFCPETQANRDARRDGASVEEYECTILDKFYNYLHSAEDQLDRVETAHKRSESVIQKLETMSAKMISFVKGESTSVNTTELGIRVEAFNANAQLFCDMNIMPVIRGDAQLNPAQLKDLRLHAPEVEGRAGLNGGLQYVLATKIEQMAREGNELVQKMIDGKQRNTGAFNTLNKLVQRLIAMNIENSDKFVRHGTTNRCEPMFILLSGPPGRGKTNAIKYLHQALFYIMGYTTHKEQRYNIDNQVYYYTGEKYFNNYKGQLIFSMDDIGQKLGSKSAPVETFEQIIRLCNSAPYNPPMAHLSDKNRMFTSEVITGTTNIELYGTPEQGGINDPGAFQRRITFELKLEADPRVLEHKGYDNVNRRDVYCVDQKLVIQHYGKKITPDIWQFYPLNPSTKKPLTTVRAGGVDFPCPKGWFSFNELSRILSNEYADRKIKYFEGVEAQEDMIDIFRKNSGMLIDHFGDPESSFASRHEAFQPLIVEEDEFVDAPEEHTGSIVDEGVCPYGLLCPSYQNGSHIKCTKWHSPEVNQLKHTALVMDGHYTVEDGKISFKNVEPRDSHLFGIKLYAQYTWDTYLQDVAMSVSSGAGEVVANIQNTWDKFTPSYQEIVNASTTRFRDFTKSVVESTWAKWLACTTGALSLVAGVYGIYQEYKKGQRNREYLENEEHDAKCLDIARRVHNDKSPCAKELEGVSYMTGPGTMEQHDFIPEGSSRSCRFFKKQGPFRTIEFSKKNTRTNRAKRAARVIPFIGCDRLAKSPEWEPARCKMSRVMNATFEIVEAEPNNTGLVANGAGKVFGPVGTITFMRGLAGVCARHVATTAGAVFRRGNVLLLRNQSNPDGVRVNQSDLDFYHCDFDGPVDMSIFVVKEHVLAACPDITHIFKTEPETMGYGGRVPITAYRLSAIDANVTVTAGDAYTCHDRLYACSDIPSAQSTNHFWLSSGGVPGHSGGTVLLMANDGRASFLGVYRGIHEGKGIGARINNGKLLKYFDAVTATRGISSWEIPEFYSKPATASDDHYKGDFVHIGETNKPVMAPKKSQFVASPIQGDVAPLMTAPAALKPFVNTQGEKIKPAVNAIEKYGTPNHYIDEKLIDTVLEAEFQKLEQTSYTPELDKVFPLHTAIYGDPEIKYFDAINAASSCGTIGREKYIAHYGPQEGPVNNNTYKLNADFTTPDGKRVNGLLYREVEAMKSQMLQGKRPFTLWEDMPKDEPRPLKKVLAGKTRYFSCTADISYLVMFRQYFGGFSASLMQNKIINGYSVGTNVYGPDWDQTVEYITAHGPDNIFAGDFAGFDSSHNRRLNSRVIDKINKYFYPKATPQENTIRRMLWYEIIESIHVHEGDIYQWLKGQPSGNPITTLLNCIVNNSSMRLCWDSIWAEVNNERMRSQLQFDRHVRHVSYGDDSITNVSDAVKHVYNQVSVARHQKKFGFNYTDEAKGEKGDIVPYKNLSEITYLKRTFEKDNVYGYYIAPLEKATLNKMTQWVKTNGEDPNSQIVERCEGAVREAALHDSEFFRSFRTRVSDALEAKGLKKFARLPHDQHALRAEIRFLGVEDNPRRFDLTNLM